MGVGAHPKAARQLDAGLQAIGRKAAGRLYRRGESQAAHQLLVVAARWGRAQEGTHITVVDRQEAAVGIALAAIHL